MKRFILGVILVSLLAFTPNALADSYGGSYGGGSGGSGGSTTINDSAGNGDTTVTYSADKIFDLLALKQALDAELTALAGLTSAANAIPYFTGSGTAGVISSSADMVALLGSDSYATARTNMGTWGVSGSITDEQLVCGETTDGSNALKSCGAKVTDNSTASHGIYKDASGYIANIPVAIDAHAASTTITLYPGICPVIHNAEQAAADINNALPSLAEGLCFIAQVRTAQAANYWRLTAATGNTVCLDGTCAKDYVSFAAPAVANFYTCIAAGTTAWHCESGRGTATTD